MDLHHEHDKRKIRVQKASLVVSVVLLVVKFGAYLATNSNAILTDALESIVNVVAGAVALYSLFYAAQPKDEDHPYGHGKVEFLSAGLEGGLILMAGLFIVVKCIYSFFYPEEIEALGLGIWLTAMAGAVNFFMGKWLEREGQTLHSPTLMADGKHLLSDAYSSIGILAGLAAVWLTDIDTIDTIVAMAFGLYIIFAGIGILRSAISGILDAADYKLLDEISNLLNQKRSPNWVDIHNLRVIRYGNALHIDCHLTLPWYFDLKRMQQEQKLLARIIEEKLGNRVELFIQSEPCVESSCQLCTKTDCPVRKHAFVKKVHWELAAMIGQDKHNLPPG